MKMLCNVAQRYSLLQMLFQILNGFLHGRAVDLILLHRFYQLRIHQLLHPPGSIYFFLSLHRPLYRLHQL
ncbi:hypothetical protein D3C77_598840 [compost metagenome]